MIGPPGTGSPPEKPLRAGIEKIDDQSALVILSDDGFEGRVSEGAVPRPPVARLIHLHHFFDSQVNVDEEVGFSIRRFYVTVLNQEAFVGSMDSFCRKWAAPR